MQPATPDGSLAARPALAAVIAGSPAGSPERLRLHALIRDWACDRLPVTVERREDIAGTIATTVMGGIGPYLSEIVNAEAVKHALEERDQLKALISAGQPALASQLLDVTAGRDDARSAFAELAGHFARGKQTGWSARISGTVLRRLCLMAMCEPPSGTGLEALAEASELVAERDRARGMADRAIALNERERAERVAERERLRRLVREALCESEMDPGQIARWLHGHGVPDLDEEWGDLDD
jgi:hypothetical protein